MKRTTTVLALALAASVSACGEEVTTSDEYQALEQESAALEQQLSDANAELADVQARLTEVQLESEVAAADPVGSSARRDATLAVMNEIRQLLDDPESFGTEEDIADLIATHATEGAMMADDVFGSVGYRQGFYNTLFGGTTDARIEIYDQWVSDDGTEGGVLWMWSGTNAKGNAFELAGISLTEHDEDGRISHELVTYPYPAEYVREAFLGAGTPTPSTG